MTLPADLADNVRAVLREDPVYRDRWFFGTDVPEPVLLADAVRVAQTADWPGAMTRASRDAIRRIPRPAPKENP